MDDETNSLPTKNSMLSLQRYRIPALALMVVTAAAAGSMSAHAQAALLMEEPYGFFGALTPTGHTAVYFARVCAESPVKLRRCEPGEEGAVISRYQGIAGYDWVAMPLIPYLYSVETVSQVPERVDRETVRRLRAQYHEEHMNELAGVPQGNIARGGWTQLVGAAYERRIYAFRFTTTQEQDDALIARLSARDNRSRFDLIYNNCADFARSILDSYFPHTFGRKFFPDAGMTTPKQITYKLARYAKKHPDTELTVFEIPQVPGYRRTSRSNKSVAASLMTTAYAVPIALLNPYIAGGLFVDYLVRGRYPLVPEHPSVLMPDGLSALTSAGLTAQNPDSAGVQAPSAAAHALMPAGSPANSGLKETVATHE